MSKSKIVVTREIQELIDERAQAATDALLRDLQGAQKQIAELSAALADAGKLEDAAPDGETVRLSKAIRVGDKMGAVGDVLAVVTLTPGVSLNFLVDAIRNGCATEQRPA